MRSDSIIEELAPYLPALRNLLCLSILIPIMAWLKPVSEQRQQENGTLYSNTKYLLRSLSYRESYLGLENTPVGAKPIDNERATIKKIEPKPESSQSPEQQELKQVQDTGLRQLKDQILQQESCRSITNRSYIDNRAVLDYKEFIEQRLPKLEQSLMLIEKDYNRRSEIIERQVSVYRNKLNRYDIEQLRNEGFLV
jgi:hypothetical protein